MTAGAEKNANALAAAALLERWADAVPMWDAAAGERWDTFAERRYVADQALEAKLRRLPTCHLTIDTSGCAVDLTLASIYVRSRVCLAQACRAWAAEIRRRVLQ